LIAAASPLVAVFALVVLVMPVTRPEAAAPEGQLTYAFHVTLAPRWLDPGETESAITPFKVLYAIHDALVKPMPGGQITPCLAESWSVTPDGTGYTFVLRQNIKFHNGEPVTAEDVKFSFERQRAARRNYEEGQGRPGARRPPGEVRPARSVARLHDVLWDHRDRRGLGQPKKYVEGRRRRLQEGADRRRPYRFVSSTPGVEIVVEAFDGYWRKTPSVKRLIFKRPGRDHARGGAQAR
jgi:peptide/nickel transport system substrate-binding protein